MNPTEPKPQTPLTDAEYAWIEINPKHPEYQIFCNARDFARSLELKFQEANETINTQHRLMVTAEKRGVDKATEEYKLKLQEAERQRDEALSDLRAHEINRPQTIPPERRFWARVNKQGSIPKHNPALGNCWEWLGAKNNFGYGMFWFEGKIIASSRVSWKFAHGEIPTLHTLHHCDNRACVNPSHLYLGTPKKNAHDRESRNRGNHTRGKDGKYSLLPHVQAKKGSA